MWGLIFSGHETELFAHSRDGITNLANYAHQFAGADVKPVRPVIGLPGADQTDTVKFGRFPHVGARSSPRSQPVVVRDVIGSTRSTTS